MILTTHQLYRYPQYFDLLVMNVRIAKRETQPAAAQPATGEDIANASAAIGANLMHEDRPQGANAGADQGKVAEATAQPKKESANNGEVPSATVPPTSNRSSAPGTNGADPNKKTIVPTAVLNPAKNNGNIKK